jgi:hypothetical protein
MAGKVGDYLQLKVLDAVFGGGASQSVFTGNATLYIGVSTQALPATDANVLLGEPTSAGNYSRIVVTNNSTNFPAASGASPATKKLHVSFSFPASNAAWSSGTTALATFFIADASTLGAGNVLWAGPLTPNADSVNGTGVTLSFAIDALQMTLD